MGSLGVGEGVSALGIQVRLLNVAHFWGWLLGSVLSSSELICSAVLEFTLEQDKCHVNSGSDGNSLCVS